MQDEILQIDCVGEEGECGRDYCIVVTKAKFSEGPDDVDSEGVE